MDPSQGRDDWEAIVLERLRGRLERVAEAPLADHGWESDAIERLRRHLEEND